MNALKGKIAQQFNMLNRCFLILTLVIWLIAAVLIALGRETIQLSVTGQLISIMGIILELAAFATPLIMDKKPRQVAVSFVILISFVFGCMTIDVCISSDNLLPKNSTDQPTQETETELSELSIRSSCIPSDTLTAIFTDMNATIEVETNFEAARVTAQSVVDGVADDVIELSQTGTYSWSAKVRFEVAGTHNIEICVYLDNGECVTDVLTVEYPFA